ncbi:MAG: hypothetical protein A2V66_17090 [Ignavibacteria bacterium RBG_13_36_8]|nr:MAG: hypothetical protein A2V66_17090 [Ignavibacteria bacterium RBG_13_36_8]
MAYGDTQEVVIAEMAAGAQPGIDRLGALGLLKFYDLEAQLTYDNFFNVPIAPAIPQVSVTELDREIVLDWSLDRDAVEATESHDQFGFTFQGYNVYQLPTDYATMAEARRIATYDKFDGIAKIEGLAFDITSGVVTRKVLQFGSDSGIQRYISITTDALSGSTPLVNGTRYYFAVTSYAFNADPNAVPNNLENTLAHITVVPQGQLPGNRIYTETSAGAEADQASGTANGAFEWWVVDPTRTSGHEYEVFFDLQHYYLDVDGHWKHTNYPDRVGKRGVTDQSAAYLTGALVTSTTVGTANLTLTVEGIEDSPDYNYADGVLIKLPPTVGINSVEEHSSRGGLLTEIDYANNTIFVGDSSRSAYGGFQGGGETIVINITMPTLPLTLWFKIYDDGWAESDPAYAGYAALGGGLVDGEGTLTVSEIGYSFRTQNHWNIKDVTADEVVVEDQTVIGGIDFYTGETHYDLDGPTFDGLQGALTAGSYETPINYYSISLESPTGLTTLSTSAGATSTRLRIINYTYFSGTISSWAYDNFGFGTTVIEELQQDYELRFTGVWAQRTLADGRTYHYIESGGQMATLFAGSSAAAVAAHPDNPTPGVDNDFLVRIPFEVWNVDDPDNEYQVNFMFRDREQLATSDPMYAWNIANRMYAVIVNSPYDEATVIPGNANPLSDFATWVLVFYGTDAHLGDVVSIVYANPIQLGIDTWTFTAPAAQSYNAELAKQDIQDELNVFPNPYYGVNSQEINKYQRFVTFSHLPTTATKNKINIVFRTHFPDICG